jgi:hypothetical protein
MSAPDLDSAPTCITPRGNVNIANEADHVNKQIAGSHRQALSDGHGTDPDVVRIIHGRVRADRDAGQYHRRRDR